jgi:hypothetical protein
MNDHGLLAIMDDPHIWMFPLWDATRPSLRGALVLALDEASQGNQIGILVCTARAIEIQRDQLYRLLAYA